ncbi:MAG: roadblock/LC7 domain-containing protein [Myxococcales bacterium]|nr:roadblock/LC7 domain-containing protein [Myxococcales bacterium]MCB9522323.1 roadblock/LC7 domain-containing protein [Myxococcales bacterium]
MSDPFFEAVNGLVTRYPGVRGAAFTDMDGEHIALAPRSQQDRLRICAAYGGIALRRLGQAEAQTDRPPVDQITVEGSKARFITLRVGSEYQLVVTLSDEQPTGSIMAAVQSTARELAAQV